MYQFSGLPPEHDTTKDSQLTEFSRQISAATKTNGISFIDWGDAFLFLSKYIIDKHSYSERVIIFLDEISWLGDKTPEFSGKLKIAWDLYFSEHPNIMLILCGSVSAWIETHLLQSTGFVGRISSVITLRPLGVGEVRAFWGPYEHNISAYEKFKLLSITGGVPKYLEDIDPRDSAEQNINRMWFRPGGLLFREFEQIFSTSVLSNSEKYREILTKLIQGPKGPRALCKSIGAELDRNTTRYLKELTEAGFITRDYTWRLKDGKVAKLSQYRIHDNYTRFYLKYIAPIQATIDQHTASYQTISEDSSWHTILGLQFENLVLNERERIFSALGYKKHQILISNPYFQNKTARQPGCQIDYLIQTRDHVLYLVEIKCSKNPIGTAVIAEVEAKMQALKTPKHLSIRPVLIYLGEITEDLADSRFFTHMIDTSQWLSG